MRLFWRETRAGRQLILEEADAQQVPVGFVLRSKLKFDAVAKTTGYAPERSKNDFETIEEAMAFVESFLPWRDFGGANDLSIEPTLQPRKV